MEGKDSSRSVDVNFIFLHHRWQQLENSSLNTCILLDHLTTRDHRLQLLDAWNLTKCCGIALESIPQTDYSRS